MRHPRALSALALAAVACSGVHAQYPTDKASAMARELQHLYLDGSASNLQSLVNPCSTYFDSSTGKVNNNAGRQTAAEWIRTAFHDFVTFSQYTFQGGLDASIGFETTRDENVGSAFNDALINFSYFFNARVSMADLIALGTVMAVGHCGGSHIPLRPGRVDATAAGPTGVPQPQQDLQTQLGQFETAGFNQDDTIALTACGHSMGGVHKASFPTVFTPGTPGTLEGTDGRDDFDQTVAAFDSGVVHDYLGNSGAKGGPLVTTTNKTMQSDLRLYISDSNSTMNRLAQSDSYFQGQCQSLFQRMLETVPLTVSLGTDVSPTTTTNLQPYNVDLNLDWKGNMVLSGQLRYVQVSGSPAAPGTYTVGLVGRDGKTTTTTGSASKSGSDTGTGLFGPTNSYSFQLKFPATTGTAGITAGGQTFTLQDTMFVIPGMSSIQPSPPQFQLNPTAMAASATYSTNITVAYYTTNPPKSLTATFSIPVTQSGTVSPKIDTSTTSTLNLIGKTGSYSIYSGITKKSLTAKQLYGLSVDVAPAGGQPGVAFYKMFNPLS